MIKLVNVTHGYGDRSILERISLQVNRGSITALMGASGCGKSTLLQIASGLLEANSGECYVDGAEPDIARKAGRLGFAFQRTLLLPWLTSEQNIDLSLRICRKRPSDVDTVDLILESVGAIQKAHAYPATLSGGEQQRIALARALVSRPHYLYLDEPFSSLDSEAREDLALLVRARAQSWRGTVLCCTHSPEEAILIADTIVVLGDVPARVIATEPVTVNEPRGKHTLYTEEFFTLRQKIKTILRGARRQ